MKRFLVIPFLVLILASCVHRSPFETSYYYEALGRPGELVVTVDAAKAKDAGVLDPSNELVKRAERVSFALEAGDEDLYPSPADNYTVYGAAEGNYGSFIVNTALSHTDGFEKVGSGDGKYYTNGQISAGVPESGLLLFSTGSYEEAYRRTFSERQTLIPKDLASIMSQSMFSVYARDPKTVMDIGFDLPVTVLLEIESALISVDRSDDGRYLLSAVIAMRSEKSARTFNTLMRNNVVADLRRKGESLDFKTLSVMIRQEGQTVVVEDMEIGVDAVTALAGKATGMVGGFI